MCGEAPVITAKVVVAKRDERTRCLRRSESVRSLHSKTGSAEAERKPLKALTTTEKAARYRQIGRETLMRPKVKQKTKRKQKKKSKAKHKRLTDKERAQFAREHYELHHTDTDKYIKPSNRRTCITANIASQNITHIVITI